MVIEFQISREDYKRFYLSHFKKVVEKNIFIFVVIPIVAGLLVTGHPYKSWHFIAGYFSTLLILFSIYVIFPFRKAMNILDKASKSGKPVFKNMKLELTTEGLSASDAVKTKDWKWNNVLKYETTKEFITITLINNTFFLIPKWSFKSDTEELDFIGTIRDNILKEKGAKYLAHVEKRRKKKYTWIFLVVAAIIITLMIFIYISFKSLEKEFESLEMNSKISLVQLNNLMKDIEFYKVQNGSYPENLEQIRKNSSISWIEDPIQDSESKDRTFYYEKVGENYYLFSRGPDGIPFTDDDLFPTIESSESGKFGIIKK